MHVEERRFPWDRNARDSRNYFFYDCVLLESRAHIGHDVPRGALEGYRVLEFDDSFTLPTSVIYRSGETDGHVLAFVERAVALAACSTIPDTPTEGPVLPARP